MNKRQRKALIDKILRLQDNWPAPNDFWQEISGWLEAQGTDETDIIKTALDNLNKKRLLVPLLIEAFKEDVISWKQIDAISGHYSIPILKELLEQQSDEVLENTWDWFG